MCPENIAPSEGLSALNSLLEKKMGHRVAKLLDNLFDIFYNWFRYPSSQLHFFPPVLGNSKHLKTLNIFLFLSLFTASWKKSTVFASCSSWCLFVLFWKGDWGGPWQKVSYLRSLCPLWCHKPRILVLLACYFWCLSQQNKSNGWVFLIPGA